MKARIVLPAFSLALLLASIPAAGSSFTRAANTFAGRAVLEGGEVTIEPFDPEDVWLYAGQDILPFDYEQGVAFTGEGMGEGGGGLVFSSRGSLYRTTLGCPAPEDLEADCYDVQAEARFAIRRDEFERGFNHIGDIDAGRAGPADGFIFGPLEKSPGTKNARGYVVYYADTLQRAGTTIETVNHCHHSWVTVDISGHWLIASDECEGLRVHEIVVDEEAAPDQRVSVVRRQDLDVRISGPWVNFAGCAFLTELNLYCNNWVDQDSFDVVSEVYRVDLRRPLGTPRAKGSSKLLFNLHASQRFTTRPVVPFAMETEGLTFYRRESAGPVEMHMLLRGERLDSFYYLHLTPQPV